MQNMLKRVIQALVCLAFIVTIKAADVNGTWTWTTPAQGNRPERTSKLTLKAEGEKLTGAISAFREGAEDIKIKDGKVAGDDVSFTIERPGRNGNTMTQKYTGKVSGDTIKGKVAFKNQNGEDQDRPWEAKRKTDGKK